MLPMARQTAVHSGCLCNEYVSLHNRHMKVVDAYQGTGDVEVLVDKNIIEKSQKFNLPVLPNYQRMAKRDIANSYTGAKKRMYVQALERIKEGYKLPTWSKIKMFLKADKFPRVDLEGPNAKAPRSIQFRSPEFNLLLASYLKPYEHGMYETLTSPVGLRCVAKGLNNVQRAENIIEAAKLFRDPVFLGMDHSKFDSCVRVTHLKWLHKQYMRTVKCNGLRNILRYVINNIGKSKNGIGYKIKGARMSGDFDTALGNTLINFLVITTGLEGIKHHILLDGDDSVLIVERSDLEGLKQKLIDHCLMMGFETVIEEYFHLHEIEFCRSKLIPTNPPRFARDPKRALSNYTITIKDYAGDSRLRYLAGVGKGELAASAGVPIMQAYALSRAKAHDNPLDIEELRIAYGVVDNPIEVDTMTRIYFEEQWGITIDEQLRIESQFETPTRVSPGHLLEYYNSLPYE